jgi:Cu/Zn superoxide dismutase
MWVSCRIGTTSHTLAAPAFHVFQQPESTIRVSDVQTNDFRIAFGHFKNEDAGEGGKVHHAHNGTRAFIVALNVARLDCSSGPQSLGFIPSMG